MPIKKTILDSLYLIRQVIFAGIILFGMLLFFNKVSAHPIFNAIGLTSVASSIFIIFSAPHTLVGQNKSIIGGYAIGILVGLACHYLLQHPLPFWPAQLYPYYPELCSCLTIVFSLTLMVLLKMPHPPAAGFAIGLVIDSWEPLTLTLIACIIVVLVIIKHLLGFKPLIMTS